MVPLKCLICVGNRSTIKQCKTPHNIEFFFIAARSCSINDVKLMVFQLNFILSSVYFTFLLISKFRKFFNESVCYVKDTQHIHHTRITRISHIRNTHVTHILSSCHKRITRKSHTDYTSVLRALHECRPRVKRMSHTLYSGHILVPHTPEIKNFQTCDN